jgi:hypothetical protein
MIFNEMVWIAGKEGFEKYALLSNDHILKIVKQWGENQRAVRSVFRLYDGRRLHR